MTTQGQKGQATLDAERDDEAYALAALGGGVEASRARCWPTPGDLAYFTALRTVFPVSDFHHPVVAPAQLMLGQYLAQCPVRGPRDVAACLMTAQTLADFCRAAKRLAPELSLALEALADQAFMAPAKAPSKAALAQLWVLPQIALAGEAGVPQLAWLRRGVSESATVAAAPRSKKAKVHPPQPSPQTLSLSMLSYGTEAEQSGAQASERVVGALCNLCAQAAAILDDSPAAPELLGRLDDALGRARERLPSHDAVVAAHEAVASARRAALAARRPMRLLDQSARSIKLIEPVFNENYRFDKDGHDPDRQRAEVKKLKKLANRERKGVARELRKDAQFIAEVRGKEKQDKYDELRAQRIRNFNMLGNLQGETDKAVRDGGARGAGSSSANLKGKRR